MHTASDSKEISSLCHSYQKANIHVPLMQPNGVFRLLIFLTIHEKGKIPNDVQMVCFLILFHEIVLQAPIAELGFQSPFFCLQLPSSQPTGHVSLG